MPDVPRPTKQPTTISIFLTDGNPDGLRIVSKSNWSGVAVVTSLLDLNKALARTELSKPAVYVLVGTDKDQKKQIYVGQADVAGVRLKQHAKTKGFWNLAIVFTSLDDSLDKADVSYLEYRLIDLARHTNRWHLENAANMNEPTLSESGKATAEVFLGEMLTIYPLLGVDAFQVASEQTSNQAEIFHMSIGEAHGQGHESRSGFTVLKGSTARINEVPSIKSWLHDLRADLVSRDVLKLHGTTYRFKEDFRFDSPTAAAGVIAGGMMNGLRHWVTESGLTLKEVQAARAESISTKIGAKPTPCSTA